MQKKECLTKTEHEAWAQTRKFTEELLAEIDELRSIAASLEHGNLELQQQNLDLHHKLDHQEREHVHLRNRLRDIESANMRFAERYLEIEQQSANLTSLYVACYRLHSTLERQEVLNAINEIIINLIGSEEVGIFELNQDNSALSLVSHLGLNPESFENIPLGAGLIGRVASTGEVYLDPKGGLNRLPQEAPLTACVPLKLDGKVIGTIAVFRLLQQKNGFDELDRQLFDLLATQAATALYSTGTRSAV